MTISSPEREAKKVKIAVDRNPVETNFEKWACDLKKECDKSICIVLFYYMNQIRFTKKEKEQKRDSV